MVLNEVKYFLFCGSGFKIERGAKMPFNGNGWGSIHFPLPSRFPISSNFDDGYDTLSLHLYLNGVVLLDGMGLKCHLQD